MFKYLTLSVLSTELEKKNSDLKNCTLADTPQLIKHVSDFQKVVVESKTFERATGTFRFLTDLRGKLLLLHLIIIIVIVTSFKLPYSSYSQNL